MLGAALWRTGSVLILESRWMRRDGWMESCEKGCCHEQRPVDGCLSPERGVTCVKGRVAARTWVFFLVWIGETRAGC